MLRPGADLIRESGLSRVALLGTQATLSSMAYQRLIAHECPGIELHPIACPLFVPLVEEGLHLHPISRQTAEHYLGCLNVQGALLACTHYPLLSGAIQEALGTSVRLLEPAERCAQNVKRALQAAALLETSSKPAVYNFYTTDDPKRFLPLAERFLGMSILSGINKLELNKNLNYS
jgi:glutamate racemase